MLLKHKIMSYFPKVIIFAFFASVSINFSQAQSNNGSYIFAYGGSAFGSDLNASFTGVGDMSLGYETGLLFGGGAGKHMDFLGGSRLELEMFRFSSDYKSASFMGNDVTSLVDSDSIALTAFAANLLKTIPLGSNAGLFFGGGLGYGSAELNGGGGDSKEGVLAYQGIAGFDFDINDKLSFFTQYKYIGFDPADSSSATVDPYGFSSISAGIRYAF